MPKKKNTNKIAGQKKNYEVLDKPATGKGSNGKQIPPCACDRKRCLNGRCGSCWMVILGFGIAVVVFAILIITGVIGFDFDTDGTDTLYEEICDGCTHEPTPNPTLAPTNDPTINPTATPTMAPTSIPTDDPTTTPSAMPTVTPTVDPTADPTTEPTADPTEQPTTAEPTSTPTLAPTAAPSTDPTANPTVDPTGNPTPQPTSQPTSDPTSTPTLEPTYNPTDTPSVEPTSDPTIPTSEPTIAPTNDPTLDPTLAPTDPTSEPTIAPTNDPTLDPTLAPTDPTSEPTSQPTGLPTGEPTSERRLFYDVKATPNVLLVVSDSRGFDAQVDNSRVDDFLKESYTFNNLESQLTWGSVITGKMMPVQTVDSLEEGHFQITGVTLVEKLIAKGYKNYYHGNWMWDSAIKSWKSFWQGWDFFYGNVDHRNQISKAIQSTLQLNGDKSWYMTVGLTKPNLGAELETEEMNPDVYDDCSRYFLEGSTYFDYARGVSCQWSMENDEIFGQILEILKTTEQWEHTLVVLLIIGEEPMFSIGGGALPAELLSRTDEDPHSFLDIAPTILSISGDSDFELELDGVDVTFGNEKWRS